MSKSLNRNVFLLKFVAMYRDLLGVNLLSKVLDKNITTSVLLGKNMDADDALKLALFFRELSNSAGYVADDLELGLLCSKFSQSKTRRLKKKAINRDRELKDIRADIKSMIELQMHRKLRTGLTNEEDLVYKYVNNLVAENRKLSAQNKELRQNGESL